MVKRRSFRYDGTLPASKSILNRLLVIASFADPERFRITGADSDADDVRHMRRGLKELPSGRPLDCGAAGTVLRFLALRVSRRPGRHELTGTPRLFSRPLGPLTDVLEQLGARVETGDASLPRLVIHGPASWRTDRPLTIDRGLSSQFASGVLLSAWDLDGPLTITFTGETVSEGYFSMTLELVRRAGLSVEDSAETLTIPPGQKVRPDTVPAEIDLSSAFALAAAAAVGGEARITPFPDASLQPDRVFVDILSAMGVPVERAGSTLEVRRAAALQPVEWCLRDSPDLFPVLGVLCALAEGRSRLFGAPHLGLKESNRIARTVQLVSALGRTVEERPDGMVVHGQGLDRVHDRPITYDPDHDHRLAMAAGVARKAGFAVEVSEPDVVNKSFPGFWSSIGEAP